MEEIKKEWWRDLFSQSLCQHTHTHATHAQRNKLIAGSSCVLVCVTKRYPWSLQINLTRRKAPAFSVNSDNSELRRKGCFGFAPRPGANMALDNPTTLCTQQTSPSKRLLHPPVQPSQLPCFLEMCLISLRHNSVIQQFSQPFMFPGKHSVLSWVKNFCLIDVESNPRVRIVQKKHGSRRRQKVGERKREGEELRKCLIPWKMENYRKYRSYLAEKDILRSCLQDINILWKRCTTDCTEHGHVT